MEPSVSDEKLSGPSPNDEDTAPPGLGQSSSEPSLLLPPAAKETSPTAKDGPSPKSPNSQLSLSRPITPLDASFGLPLSRERKLQSRDGSCPPSVSQPQSQGTTRLPKVHSDGMASTLARTQADPHELGRTRVNSGKLGRTRSNSGELARTQGNSGELARTRSNSGELAQTRANSLELG